MKIGPILFSTPMVQAIQREEGPKTQTRRVFEFNMRDGRNPNFNGYSLGEYCSGHIDTGAVLYSRRGDGGWEQVTDPVKPRYLPGDILWVRETWGRYPVYNGHSYAFKAEYIDSENLEKAKRLVGRWRPSIHMPREAARIFLRVTAVRAERLQDISTKDCIAEGIEHDDSNNAKPGSNEAISIDNWNWEYSRFMYKQLWDDLNAKRGYGWDTNPWVWVYTFERAEKPAGWPEVIAA